MAKRRKFISEFKMELVLEVLSGATSQAEVCRRHNLNENQLSQWKQQLVENASMLFDSTDKQSSKVSKKRIAHLGQLVGRMETVALDIQKNYGVEISVVSRRGRPWENGYAERLIRTLKEEEVHINDYQSITEARDHIGHFITQVYNQKRPHSALGYLTPMEFQQQTLS